MIVELTIHIEIGTKYRQIIKKQEIILGMERNS